MFTTAYLAARFLWVALIACWLAAKGAPGRAAMWAPFVVALAATIWEALVPASMNIRLDLILVTGLLIVADGLAGIVLAANAFQSRGKRVSGNGAIAAAAVLCLGACGGLISGWVYSTKQSEQQWTEYLDGSRRYFEAAFRDDETQRASFGNLEGTRWAGYYAADPPQPNYAHLVVNSAGDYFAYSSSFGERRGKLSPDPADPALLTGKRIHAGVPGADVQIRDLGAGRLQFSEREGGITGEAAFVSKPPPRFLRPASANDKVRFKGVFSGIYDDSSAKWVGLAQVWLWESEGRWWAAWLRGTISRERAQPVSASRGNDVSCADKACETLEVHFEGGRRERLRWQSPDSLAWTESGRRVVILKRGELVTGLPQAWAPLTTMEENRSWLRSLHPEITWQAPAKK